MEIHDNLAKSLGTNKRLTGELRAAIEDTIQSRAPVVFESRRTRSAKKPPPVPAKPADIEKRIPSRGPPPVKKVKVTVQEVPVPVATSVEDLYTLTNPQLLDEMILKNFSQPNQTRIANDLRNGVVELVWAPLLDFLPEKDEKGEKWSLESTYSENPALPFLKDLKFVDDKILGGGKNWRMQMKLQELGCAYCVAIKRKWKACISEDKSSTLGLQVCQFCAHSSMFCIVPVIGAADWLLVFGSGGAKTMLPSR